MVDREIRRRLEWVNKRTQLSNEPLTETQIEYLSFIFSDATFFTTLKPTESHTKINMKNVTDKIEVIELLYKRSLLENLIKDIDKEALIKYELEAINS